MKIIIGLGNPGRKYERTRHNAGFMVVDELSRVFRFEISQEKYHALIGRGRIDSEQVVLVKPQTYMNESGKAVSAVIRDTYTDVSSLVVVHDELDLPSGVVRIKIGGGHGGHNGLRSLIEQLGTPEFVRVRIGIGRPAPGVESADYVLSHFSLDERQSLIRVLERAVEAVKVVIVEGPTKAMNLFNQK